jgi:ABC-type lipoprotein release transport system permease subunit
VIVGEVQRPLLVMLGAVGLVLLVACANVANLLLARGSARQGRAVGARRNRRRPRPVDSQLVTESVLLGLIGGALGLALAYWSTQALVAARPADLPRIDDIRLNATVVWFTFGAALITSLLAGLVPACKPPTIISCRDYRRAAAAAAVDAKTQSAPRGLVSRKWRWPSSC